METDQPFAEYEPDLFPRLTRIGNALASLVHFLPDTPLATHGDTLPNDLRETPEAQE